MNEIVQIGWIEVSELSFPLNISCLRIVFHFECIVAGLAIRARVIFRGLACRALASVNLRLDCTVLSLTE